MERGKLKRNIQEPGLVQQDLIHLKNNLQLLLNIYNKILVNRFFTPVNFEAESVFIDVVRFFVEGNTEEIKKAVNIAKQEIKEELQGIKNAMDSNKEIPTKNILKNPYKADIEEKDFDSIINNAGRNINELCLLVTELQYHRQFEVVSCTLCVNQTSFKTFRDPYRETETKIFLKIITFK